MKAEEIFHKHFGQVLHPPFNASLHRYIETERMSGNVLIKVQDAMKEFADQELLSYKERLKIKLVREWHKKTGDEIYDLIDTEI